MTKTEKAELNEIAQVIDAACKRHELAFEAYKQGQITIAETSSNQVQEMCKHIKGRLKNLQNGGF